MIAVTAHPRSRMCHFQLQSRLWKLAITQGLADQSPSAYQQTIRPRSCCFIAQNCRLPPIKGGKSPLQAFKFRQVVNGDVWLIAMARHVVLMIRLSRKETVERNYFGYDWVGEHFLVIELRNVGVSHLPLLVVRVEDRRPVLSS